MHPVTVHSNIFIYFLLIFNFASNIYCIIYLKLNILDYKNRVLAVDSPKHSRFYLQIGSKSLGSFAFYCKEDPCAQLKDNIDSNLNYLFKKLNHAINT